MRKHALSKIITSLFGQVFVYIVIWQKMIKNWISVIEGNYFFSQNFICVWTYTFQVFQAQYEQYRLQRVARLVPDCSVYNVTHMYMGGPISSLRHCPTVLLSQEKCVVPYCRRLLTKFQPDPACFISIACESMSVRWI